MMKIRNQLLLFTLIIVFLLSTALTTYAGTWEQDSRGWKYIDNNGQYTTGWVLDNGKYYYLGNDNYMLADAVTPDGYYVNGTGEWVNGVDSINNRVNSGNWNISGDVIDSVITEGVSLCQEAKESGLSIGNKTQLINVRASDAEYNNGDITLTKSGNEYTVDIGVRSNNINQKALKQLLRLTGYTNVDELYNTLYQSFEGTGSPINFESFVDIAGHQIKAVNNGNSITYIIK